MLFLFQLKWFLKTKNLKSILNSGLNGILWKAIFITNKKKIFSSMFCSALVGPTTTIPHTLISIFKYNVLCVSWDQRRVKYFIPAVIFRV